MEHYKEISDKIKSIFWDTDEQTYRSHPAISQSALSKFDREGFRRIQEETTITGAMTRGSLIDCLLTEPDMFDSKYYVASYCPITDKPKGIIDTIYESYGHLYDELRDVPEEYILRIIKEEDYYPNRKDETNIKNIIKEGTIYYQNLVRGKGKEVILEANYKEAKNTADCLINHRYTEKYFNKMKLSEYEEIIYQPKILLEDDRLPYKLKCMFDVIYINHKDKYIKPMDLKTTSKDEDRFEENFISWRYDLQSSLYTFMLKYKLKEKGIKYDIKNFTFIVINPRNLTPVLWEDNNCFNVQDRMNKYGTIYKGPFTLARELYFHHSTNNYSYDLETVENNGVKQLDIFKPAVVVK